MAKVTSRSGGVRQVRLGQEVLRADALVVRALNPVLARFGIAIEVFRALRVLDGSSGMTVGELGRLIDANPPATTRIVDRLVSAGLAYRRADDSDRRRILVMISGAGVDLFQEMLDELDQMEAHLDPLTRYA